MVSELDKIYYRSYIRDHDAAVEQVNKRGEEFFDLVDYLYKGGVDNGSKEIEIMDEVNFIRALRPVCRNNAWRAVDTAASIMSKRDSSGIESDPEAINEADYKAALQNFYSSDSFIDEMEETKDGQNKLDLLLAGKDEGYDGTRGEPSKEEVQFRNWLAKQADYDKHIRDVLEWFGNFYAYANELKRENYERSSNIERITQGNSIRDLVPSEFATLGIEEVDILFDMAYAMEQLMEFDRTSISEGKSGPITLGLDLSGSMDMNGQRIGKYSKMSVAVGFVMAIIRAMEDEDRRVQVFGFRYNVVKLLPPSESIESRLKELLGLNASGSTSLQTALLHSLEVASKDDDVLMVTDGVDNDIDSVRINGLKGQRKISTLLISEYAPDTMKMREVSDSFILTNGADGFEQLMTEVVK